MGIKEMNQSNCNKITEEQNMGKQMDLTSSTLALHINIEEKAKELMLLKELTEAKYHEPLQMSKDTMVRFQPETEEAQGEKFIKERENRVVIPTLPSAENQNSTPT